MGEAMPPFDAWRCHNAAHEHNLAHGRECLATRSRGEGPAEAATPAGPPEVDTAAIRAAWTSGPYSLRTIEALCALDASRADLDDARKAGAAMTLNRAYERARAETAEQQRDDARGLAAALEAELAEVRALCERDAEEYCYDHERFVVEILTALDRSTATCSCAGLSPTGWHESSCATVRQPGRAERDAEKAAAVLARVRAAVDVGATPALILDEATHDD